MTITELSQIDQPRVINSPLNAYVQPSHVEAVNRPATVNVLDSHVPPNVGPQSMALVSAATERGWMTISSDTRQNVYLIDGKIVEGPPNDETAEQVKEELSKGSPIVVFGTCAGQQIHMLRSMTAEPVLVFEPDPGVLKRFLNLGYSLPGVSVTCDIDEFREMFGAFLRGNSSAMIVSQQSYVSLYPSEHTEFVDVFKRILDAEHVTTQTIEARMPEWIAHTLDNLPVLAKSNARAAMSLSGAFAGQTAFIVGAGPSLEKHWDLLAECKNKGIVIAIDVVGKALDLHGFEPDFFLTVEGKDISKKLTDISWMSTVPRLWTLACNPNTFALGNGPLLAWADSNVPFKDMCLDILRGEGLPIGGSCTTAAELFAEVFGCERIVMIGNDLVNASGVERPNHCEGVDTGDLVHRHSVAGTVKPWGENGPDLDDSPIWRHARVWFEQRSATLARENPSMRLFNCSEGGSHVDGWDDVPLQKLLYTLPDRSVDVSKAISGLPTIDADTVREWIGKQASALESAIPHCDKLVAHSRTSIDMLRAGKEPSEVNVELDERNAAESAFRGAVGHHALFSGWTQRLLRELIEEQKRNVNGGDLTPDKAADMLESDSNRWESIATAAKELAGMLRAAEGR